MTPQSTPYDSIIGRSSACALDDLVPQSPHPDSRTPPLPTTDEAQDRGFASHEPMSPLEAPQGEKSHGAQS